MGLQVCEECGCVIWCSVTGYFPSNPHAEGCPVIGRESRIVGEYECKVCGKECNGLVNDEYCIKCWDER